jgi:hypothetical protein
MPAVSEEGLMKATTGPYRTLPVVGPAVFSKSCVYREHRIPIAPVPQVNGSTSTAEHDFCRHADVAHAHPVTGERVVDRETLCEAKNAQLDCLDYETPAPTWPASWWATIQRRRKRKI